MSTLSRKRVKKWNVITQAYGESWVVGDIIALLHQFAARAKGKRLVFTRGTGMVSFFC